MEKVEHMLKSAERVAMTAGEKSRVRDRISAFIDAGHSRPVASPYAGGIARNPFFAYVERHAFGAFVATMFLLGGGVSLAANDALPGEPLYAVKVNINEPVAGLTAFSPEAKAAYETTLAKTRLEEAASLSAEGRLTPAVRSQIEQDLASHIDKAEAKVQELASDDKIRGAVEVNSELESTLRAHQRVLTDLAATSGEAGSVASAIRQELTSVSQTLNELEGKISRDGNPESENQARMKSLQAEAKLNEARIAISEKGGAIDAEVMADVKKHIEQAYEKLSEGYALIERGSYNKAFVQFQAAIRSGNEAQVVLNAAYKLKLRSAAKPEPVSEATTTPPMSGTTTPPAAAEGDSASTTAGTTTSDMRLAAPEAETEVDLGVFMGTSTKASASLREQAAKKKQEIRAMLLNIGF